jgi:hypothetical protein
MLEYNYSAASPSLEGWQYIHIATDRKPPKGKKIQILHKDGTCFYGLWRDDCNYIAWAELLKRNKEKEASLPLATNPSVAKFRNQ